jgi:VanZ family protein
VKRFNKYIPAVLLGLIILTFTVIPGETVTSAGLNKETYHINGHFIMYLLLSIALFKGTKNKGISCIVSAIYGTLLEFIQKSIPGRAFQYLDIAVNSFGSLLAFFILWKRSLILPKKLKNWLEK